MTGPWDIDEVPERDVTGAEVTVLLALSSRVYQLHRRHEAFLHVALGNATESMGGQVVQWTVCESLSTLPNNAGFAISADFSPMNARDQSFVHGMVFGAICALQALAETDAARRTDGA